MPKINVYLPDDLAASVRQAGIPVSAVCQQALAEAVRLVGAAREAIAAIREPGFDPEQHLQIGGLLAAQMTPRLRRVLRHAREAAGHGTPIGSEHLLIGLIDDGENLGVRVLELLDVDPAALRETIPTGDGGAQVSSPQPSPAGTSPRGTALLAGLSADGRLALADGWEGAVELGHTYLGSEHLLLGLVARPDATGALLRDRGVEAPRVRRAIPAAVGATSLGYAHSLRLLGPGGGERLDELEQRMVQLEERVAAGGL